MSEPSEVKLQVTVDGVDYSYPISSSSPPPSGAEGYGVVVPCTGIDDTATMDAAVAQAASENTSVVLLGGNYVRTSSWILPDGTRVWGQGRLKSRVTFTSAAAAGIVAANCPTGVHLSDFGVDSPGKMSVQLGDPTHPSNHSIVERMAFYGGTYSLALYNCSACSILHNHWLAGFTTGAILIAAPINPDGGDNLIDDAWIIGSSNAPTGPLGIQHLSGGGWKITNSKILTVLRAYWGFYGMGASAMSSLIITDNSFEGSGQDCIALTRQSGSTGPMLHVVIANNQLSALRGAGINVPDIGATWVQHLTASGNIVNNVNAQNGIVIGSTTGFTVTGGEIGEHGTPTGPGIVIGPTASNGIVGPVAVNGYATKISSVGVNVTLGTIGP